MASKPNPFAKKAAGAKDAKPAPGKPGDKKLPPWLQKKAPAMKSGGMVRRGFGKARGA